MKLKNIVYCKCGCGQEVDDGNTYVHGHNRRGLHSYIIPEGYDRGDTDYKIDKMKEIGITIKVVRNKDFQH